MAYKLHLLIKNESVTFGRIVRGFDGFECIVGVVRGREFSQS